MPENNIPKIIVITGAESTGKSVLTQQLANYYNVPFYPEFAREYISSLNRKYTIDDVEIIAKKQIEQYHESLSLRHKYIFFDTWLIITKVWFEVVYNFYPGWIIENLTNAKISGFILNDTDIPWEPDPLRENGGEKREILQKNYIKNIHDFNFKYFVNSGVGAERFKNAVQQIEIIFG